MHWARNWVTEGVITTRSNRMKFRLSNRCMILVLTFYVRFLLLATCICLSQLEVFIFFIVDLYITVYLMRGQRILQSYRTSKKKGSSDILFYENYSFDLSSLDLNELTLRLTAMHCCKHVINTDHVIGQVDTDDRTSKTSFGCHWLEVITSSRRSVNKWHTFWC